MGGLVRRHVTRVQVMLCLAPTRVRAEPLLIAAALHCSSRDPAKARIRPLDATYLDLMANLPKRLTKKALNDSDSGNNRLCCCDNLLRFPSLHQNIITYTLDTKEGKQTCPPKPSRILFYKSSAKSAFAARIPLQLGTSLRSTWECGGTWQDQSCSGA